MKKFGAALIALATAYMLVIAIAQVNAVLEMVDSSTIGTTGTIGCTNEIAKKH